MKSEAKKAAARRYASRQRALRLTEGNCGSCGRTSLKVGACASCLTYQKDLRDARRASGMCLHCGRRPAASGRRRCAKCCIAIAERNRNRYAAKAAEGFCKCGRPLREDRHNCQHCHDNTGSRKHGLTRIEAEALLHSQQGACKLCAVMIDPSIGGTKPHVDHDHETGRVRGVLCQRCNIALGGLESFWRRGLQDRLAEYLQK